MSRFEDELAALEATRCPTCRGAGECDDAELGDISFRTWTCRACGGSGKKCEPVKREPVGSDEKGALYKHDLDADALRDGFLRRSRL